MQDIFAKIGLRQFRLLLLGLGAVITVATIVSIVVPKAKALRIANSEIGILERAAQDSDELDRYVQEQHASIEELKFRLYGDMANLPARQVEAYIIGRLQRVSWNNNVELVSVRPATGDRVQIFQEMLFNVQLKGQYGDLYRWLWETRDDLGYVVVKEYGLKRHDNIDKHPQLVANLSLASYRATE